MKVISSKKNERILAGILIFIALLMAVFSCINEIKNRRLRFVEQMGNGINVGNSLDATNLRDFSPNADDLEYETFWGNPKIARSLFKTIHEAGFQTVRIPVTFEDHLDEAYNISERWMDRVEEVISYAIDEELYVILDLHGDEWLDLLVKDKKRIKQQFEKVWQQIAVRFRDYGDHLLFEGMNEPRLRDSEYEWTSGTKELRSFVNELNQLFVDVVRNTGGNNENRYLMISPYCNGPWEETVAALKVPKGNIIVAVHMYRPYGFAQNRKGTAEWSQEFPEDTKEIRESFQLMYAECIREKIPVIFTEYGCVDKNNIEERIKWAMYHMKLSKKYRIPCIWWDNGKEYKLIDRINNTWIYPELVEVITHSSSQK